MSHPTGELTIPHPQLAPSRYDFRGLNVAERYRYSRHLAGAAETLAKAGLGDVAAEYATPLRGWRTIAHLRQAGSLGIHSFVLAERQHGIGIAQTRTHERPVLPSSNEATESRQISYWLGDPEAGNRQVHEAVLTFLTRGTDRTAEVWTVIPEMPLSYSVDDRRLGWRLMETQISALEMAGFTEQGSIEDFPGLVSKEMPFGTLYVRPAPPARAV